MNNPIQNDRALVDFIFEVGQLKRIPHIGWLHAGIKDPERVGEHVFRASQIAYLLADQEGAEIYKTTVMTLIHDNGEARIGDHDLITRRYINGQAAEAEAFRDQCDHLPDHIGKNWKALFQEREEVKTLEAKCSKDADNLEQAFQAKEYMEQGYQNVQSWIETIEKNLHTETAKKLLKIMKKRSFFDWAREAKK